MHAFHVGLTSFLLSLTSAAASQSQVSLAGEWQFAADPQDLGLNQGWATMLLAGTIRLPGTTDEAGIGELQADTGKSLGVLVRKHNYLGVVWYARDITIPSNPNASDWELTLERVIWQSRVFVDGHETGAPQDSLCSAHRHRLGKLTPGRHRLAIRVDNRMIHPIGNKNHAYGEQTQSRWNGIVGRIELAPVEAVTMDRLRVSTPTLGRAEIEVRISGSTAGLQLRATLTDPATGERVGSNETVASAGRITVTADVPVTAWSEFSPKLYLTKVELMRDGEVCASAETRTGFRQIAREGNRLLINGQPAFMRGNLDCVHFPITGYPATSKDEWLKIFRIYQEHNLNHVRFHSWCPPEAAFEAADELGLYVQAEGPIWIDNWMTHPNKRPEMDCEGHPQGLGRGDRSIDAFAQAEFRRILDAYGNHPSFVFFCFGNELGADNFAVTGRWVADLKQYDPRRLYAASTARTITPNCDFSATHQIPGAGACRQHYQFGGNWDYQKIYAASSVPIIAHEVGQWPVYPDWGLSAKFTGTLRNTRLEALCKQAKANGVFDDQAALTHASGALNQRLYKDEIESFLRTPDCRGFQLLSLQDFPGQGEAYVGWYDCFWQSKQTTDAGEFRGYCAPVVALAKLTTYVFSDGDTLCGDLLVRNDGPVDLKGVVLTAKLVDASGTTLSRATFPVSAAMGQLVTVGTLSMPLAAPSARRLTLVLELEGKRDSNSYPLWVYPRSIPAMDDAKLVISHEFDRATEAALAEGRSVLLVANRLGDSRAAKSAAWMPLYWSTPFFPGQKIETLGLLVRHEQPAFGDFPTEHFNDWQWYRLCRGARGFDLTGMVPTGFQPLAQPVSDFHLNRKLGSIFECRVGPGRLLVCGYDLDADLPEARQLAYSLKRYMASAAFQPGKPLEVAQLRIMFKSGGGREIQLPAELAAADFYLSAAGKLTKPGRVAAQPGHDQVVVARDGYRLLGSQADACWKDDVCSAWVGKKLGFQLQVPSGSAGTLWVRFNDHNHAGRRAKITFEGRESRLGPHDAEASGQWVKIEIMREDALDSTLNFSAQCEAGPNLMISDIAFIPKL